MRARVHEAQASGGGVSWRVDLPADVSALVRREGWHGGCFEPRHTLEERLRAEAMAADARFIPVFFTAAWAFRPPYDTPDA